MIGFLRAVAAGGPAEAAGLAPPARAAGLSVTLLAGILVFLAALAGALGLSAARVAGEWSGPGASAATLFVVAADEADMEAQARAALAVLRDAPGVRSVRLVELDEQRALLAPWLGSEVALDGLPLPLLIEVEADRDALDRPALEARLATEAPGAVFDDHAGWRGPLVAASRRMGLASVAILAALAAAMAAALALAAGSSVAASGDAVATLRLVGARDRLIVAAFVRPLLRRAAIGAALGGLAAVAILLAMPARGSGDTLGLGMRPAGWEWLAILLAPPVGAAIAWAAATRAVRRALRRWS
ncbi:cell division protein FtsX [Amaricoccus sp.]|uniref:cell division protein FtsX n=1 Tax=Amaricoccus sp. TaxID=1872485 RepID=UPI001B73F01B|nr:cell division protein FtsX [Amaricoccus sp.]MBP7003606.1 cell division protein FtsX [Amaricoccus sp.]